MNVGNYKFVPPTKRACNDKAVQRERSVGNDQDVGGSKDRLMQKSKSVTHHCSLTLSRSCGRKTA